MEKIKKTLMGELDKINISLNNKEQLNFDNYAVLFLASIMEEERNECNNEEKRKKGD